MTLGIATPIEVKDITELENIDTVEARAYARFAVTRSVMRQMIDLMENLYNQQTEQINALNTLQEHEEEI